MAGDQNGASGRTGGAAAVLARSRCACGRRGMEAERRDAGGVRAAVWGSCEPAGPLGPLRFLWAKHRCRSKKGNASSIARTSPSAPSLTTSNGSASPRLFRPCSNDTQLS